MGYIVTAPLVITKKADKSDLYLYENSEVPDFVSAEECKRLADAGLVKEVSESSSPETKARSAKKPAAESN